MNKTTTEPSVQMLCTRMADLRQRHSYTLEQLAAASGVSRSMLSQIERGQANPTLAVTSRIAQAFGMSVGELVDDPMASGTIEIVHGNDPSHVFRADGGCRIRTLSPLHMEKNVEFYELELQPGAALESAPHFDGTRELFTVATGAARLVAGETACELESGDSAQYRADVEHTISARGDTPLVGYIVVTYR